MNMHQEQEKSKSIVPDKDHQKWMKQIRQEFMLLVAAQDVEFSPCSSRRNSRRIWVTEGGEGGLGRAPLLERQDGFHKGKSLESVP
jgi:hypothetical protein